MPIAVTAHELRSRPMKTRFPFRYGIASMTALPHDFLILDAAVDGATSRGLASEGLPPKWFTKDPGTRFEDDLPAMREVCLRAVDHAVDLGERPSVFEFWIALYEQQARWAEGRGIPPLLAHLGTSLVERALIDAFCRARETTFHRALQDGSLGVDLGAVHPQLAGSSPATWLPAEPLAHIVARHTVGLGDPLREADIPPDERCGDGLPHGLDSAIERYGLTHFKIKLGGDLDADRQRLRQLAELLGEMAPGYRFTLDGNEQYPDLATFREHWEALAAAPGLAAMLGGEHLLFVEQPLHRDSALDDSVADGFASWPGAPPVIIDESDAEIGSLPRALALGYSGTSHKNCKGVLKGVANACLVAARSRETPARPAIMSGEDLANVGPVALLNDLAAMAALGITHVERNGHHYFAGLSMFPKELQLAACDAHPDLYAITQTAGRELTTLQINDGRIATSSVNHAPFGCALPLDTNTLDALAPA